MRTNHQNALACSKLSAQLRHRSWRKIQGSLIQAAGILLSITELYSSSIHLKLTRLYCYDVIAVCWPQRLKGRHVHCNLKVYKNRLSYIFFPSVGLKIHIELVCFDDRGKKFWCAVCFFVSFPLFLTVIAAIVNAASLFFIEKGI